MLPITSKEDLPLTRLASVLCMSQRSDSQALSSFPKMKMKAYWQAVINEHLLSKDKHLLSFRKFEHD